MSLNNLYENYPQLREEWDGDIEDMKKYNGGSHRKVNWKCGSNNPCHKWSASICSRTNKNPSGCPFCSGMKTCPCDMCPNLYNEHVELREEWNGDIREMKFYASGSNKKITWKCKSGNPCHVWSAAIYSRTMDDPVGCLYCLNRKICTCDICPNLYNNFPELRHEWDGDIQEMKTYAYGSGQKVNWKCALNPHHRWNTSINSRTNKNTLTGCPFCSNKRTCTCDTCPNLYNNFPHLREEWDGDLDEMKTYTSSSGQKVSWKCRLNQSHKWSSVISHRTRKDGPTGCPLCKNKTESILFEYLCSLNFAIERERNYHWLEGKRRFDFVVNNKTIIELDGTQHFEQVSNWKDPISTQDNDIDKMNKALENGLNMIRIHQEDIYYDRIDWRNEIKEAVEYMEDKTGALKFINEVYYEHFQVE